MKKSFVFASVMTMALASGSVLAKGVKDIVPEIVQAAANSAVVDAVKSQNAKGLSLEKIQSMDNEWKGASEPNDFMKSHLENDAAKALSVLENSSGYLVEFIVTDNQGANVALTGITSDYWQGDEPKFTNAFADGKGNTYIARPQKDKSTGEVVSQVSVPVMSDGKAIGTLTVGVRMDQLN